MGQRLPQQRKGKGTPKYRAPKFKFKFRVGYRSYDEVEKKSVIKGMVKNLIIHPSYTGLIMEVFLENDEKVYLFAPEGIGIWDKIEIGAKAELSIGNVLPLSEIPDGAPVYNIEITPGSGGELIKSAGNCGYVSGHLNDGVQVTLPSKRVKLFDKDCRAQVGLVSGGGRLEKPFYKAGQMFFEARKETLRWPKVRGVAQSPYSHPFGGKEHHPGRSTIVSRYAPPGAKVGLVAARQVGRKRGKKRK